jgi:ADP-heptose:LPS heptosyltransferase
MNFLSSPQKKDLKQIFMSADKNKKIIHHPERGNRALKFFDRYAGIPLALGLGLLRRKQIPLPGQDVRRAAFLQTAAIGDTVLSSAVVQDLKKAWPHAEVTFFTGSSNYETAGLIPGIDSIIKLPIKTPLSARKLIRQAGTFDIWIDFGPWPRLNAILSCFAQAGITVGFETKDQYRHYAYDVTVKHSSHRHEIENYRALLKGFGISDTANAPMLNIEARPKRAKQIVMHMFPGGSRSYLKEWPEHRWAALITTFVDQGYTVFLTGAAPDQARATAVKNRVKGADRVFIVAGSQTIREVAELLSASQLTISVDTGIMHLASALGCNLISLHGPTSPKRWGPLNNNAVPVQGGASCSPCLSLGFESKCDDPKCMAAISVEEVYAAATRLLHPDSERKG